MADSKRISELQVLGEAHYKEKRFSDALHCIVEMRSLGADGAELQLLEADCLSYLRRTPEAILILRRLLAHEPHNANYLIKLSYYLRDVGEFEESASLLTRVPETMPGRAYIHGWHSMRLGKFGEGFSELEPEIGIYRAGTLFKLPPEKKLSSDPVVGKRIFFVLEGGAGDELAYCRFATLLEKRGARVIVGASARLVPLIARMGSSDVRDSTSVFPDEYDHYLGSMSAIPYFNISAAHLVPAAPSLSVNIDQREKWLPAITDAAGGKTKVGIHWQGNWGFDYLERKSMPASDMMVLQEAGALFSLQRDAGENILPAHAGVFDTEEGPASWERTAAVISCMDYVVTNDTSTAHLSAALGVKTLVILPIAPHHYWLPLEGKNPWYPDIRTFRQPQYNDWRGALLNARDHILQDSKHLS